MTYRFSLSHHDLALVLGALSKFQDDDPDVVCVLRGLRDTLRDRLLREQGRQDRRAELRKARKAGV